jgi:hypothetical protein
MDTIKKTALEVLAETIDELPSEDDALRASVTRLGDGQTNPDE